MVLHDLDFTDSLFDARKMFDYREPDLIGVEIGVEEEHRVRPWSTVDREVVNRERSPTVLVMNRRFALLRFAHRVVVKTGTTIAFPWGQGTVNAFPRQAKFLSGQPERVTLSVVEEVADAMPTTEMDHVSTRPNLFVHEVIIPPLSSVVSY